MQIYIKPKIEARLRQEENMSGLVNNLLELHYEQVEAFSSGVVKTSWEKADKELREPEEAQEDDLSDYEKSTIPTLVFDASTPTRAYDPIEDEFVRIKRVKGKVRIITP